jgi:hypothetical protein
MTPISVNHMTKPDKSTIVLLDVPTALGWVDGDQHNQLKARPLHAKKPSSIRDEIADPHSKLHTFANQYVKSAELVAANRWLVDQCNLPGSAKLILRQKSLRFQGIFSFEALVPDIHHLNDPTDALLGSVAFVNSYASELVA